MEDILPRSQCVSVYSPAPRLLFTKSSMANTSHDVSFIERTTKVTFIKQIGYDVIDSLIGP